MSCTGHTVYAAEYRNVGEAYYVVKEGFGLLVKDCSGRSAVFKVY